MPKLPASKIRDRLNARGEELIALGFTEIGTDILFLSQETKQRPSRKTERGPRVKDPRTPEAIDLAIHNMARDNPGIMNKEIANRVGVPEARVSNVLSGKRDET